MKERPILMSAPMVRAILEGRKTQTRRIVKGDLHTWSPPLAEAVPSLLAHTGDLWDFRRNLHNPVAIRCPYGAPGDRLWVRETWRTMEREPDMVDGIRYYADSAFIPIENTRDATDRWVVAHNNGKHGVAFRPSIHMPRWASRITLEVTGVRVERLQSISEGDARAEGVEPTVFTRKVYPSKHAADVVVAERYRDSFELLWAQINGAASWLENPWVWVVEFKRVQQ